MGSPEEEKGEISSPGARQILTEKIYTTREAEE
jgi:hypothetical protein